MPDDSLRTDTGLYLPPGEQTNEMVRQQRLKVAIEEESVQISEWVKSWERDGQKPLDRIAIQQALVTRASVYLWPPSFMTSIFQRVMDILEAEKPPEPETRQQKRHRERREGQTRLRAVRPELDAADPSGDGVDRGSLPPLKGYSPEELPPKPPNSQF
jgi:hypothetical protein